MCVPSLHFCSSPLHPDCFFFSIIAFPGSIQCQFDKVWKMYSTKLGEIKIDILIQTNKKTIYRICARCSNCNTCSDFTCSIRKTYIALDLIKRRKLKRIYQLKLLKLTEQKCSLDFDNLVSVGQGASIFQYQMPNWKAICDQWVHFTGLLCIEDAFLGLNCPDSFSFKKAASNNIKNTFCVIVHYLLCSGGPWRRRKM